MMSAAYAADDMKKIAMPSLVQEAHGVTREAVLKLTAEPGLDHEVSALARKRDLAAFGAEDVVEPTWKAKGRKQPEANASEAVAAPLPQNPKEQKLMEAQSKANKAERIVKRIWSLNQEAMRKFALEERDEEHWAKESARRMSATVDAMYSMAVPHNAAVATRLKLAEERVGKALSAAKSLWAMAEAGLFKYRKDKMIQEEWAANSTKDIFDEYQASMISTVGDLEAGNGSNSPMKENSSALANSTEESDRWPNNASSWMMNYSSVLASGADNE